MKIYPRAHQRRACRAVPKMNDLSQIQISVVVCIASFRKMRKLENSPYLPAIFACSRKMAAAVTRNSTYVDANTDDRGIATMILNSVKGVRV